MPTVSWPHVALGALFALAVTALVGAGVASVASLGVGAYAASRLAGHHGLLQGAATASGFLLAAAILDSIAAVPLLPSDTVLLIAFDTVHLLIGAVTGWLATRS